MTKSKLMLVICFVFFTFSILSVSIVNAKDYKQNPEDVKGIGYINSIETINKQNEQIRASMYNQMEESIKTIQLDEEKFIKANDIDVESLQKTLNLSTQLKYINSIAVLDDMKYIASKDNYKPEQSSDKIKRRVEDIQKSSQEAYEYIIYSITDFSNHEQNIKGTTEYESLSNEVKDKMDLVISDKYDALEKQLKSIVKDLDIYEPLDNNIITLLGKFDFSNEEVIDINNYRRDISSDINEIDLEIKDLNKKEETADTTSADISSTSSSTPSQNAAPAAAVKGGSGASAEDKSSSGGSCGWKTDCYCVEHYSAEGYTQYIPEEDLCMFPDPGYVGYDRNLEKEVLNVINDHREDVGVPRLSYDNSLQACADNSSKAYYETQIPHGYFRNGHSECDISQSENAIWAGGVINSRQIVDTWINSPCHERTQVNPLYTRAAVSLYYSPTKELYGVVEFA